jgi:hypothetical protein
MTAVLYQALGNELCQPLRKRQIVDPENRLKDFGSFAVFDLTRVDSIVAEKGQNCINAKQFPDHLAFLPSRLTWLEFQYYKETERAAVILQQADAETLLCWHVCYVRDHPFLVQREFIVPIVNTANHKVGTVGWHQDDPLFRAPKDKQEIGMCVVDMAIQRVLGALIVINTPRPGDRETFLPHAGLQRKLAAARGIVGKFPLLATTEIRLPTGAEADQKPEKQATQLTGQIPFHRVRTHLWRGRRIEEYWRGNPAVGIKNSRYVVYDSEVRTGT